MKLSIITINLNNKAGLEKTMKSVLSQTCKDYEWIVIDGGSTDGSRELIEQNAQHIAYWVSEKDKGIYNAMNKGVDVAQGDYLQFLNSGDYLAEDNIIEEFLSLHPTEDVIYGNAIFINKEGEVVQKYIAPEIVGLLYLIYSSLNHQAMFFHKRCFDNYRYNEEYHVVSDMDLVIRLFYHGFSFNKWNEFVVYYEKGGISDTYSVSFRERRSIILKKLIPPGIMADYEEIVMFRDVDLAKMIKTIIRSNRFMRNLTRVVLYPIYFLCKK